MKKIMPIILTVIILGCGSSPKIQKLGLGNNPLNTDLKPTLAFENVVDDIISIQDYLIRNNGRLEISKVSSVEKKTGLEGLTYETIKHYESFDGFIAVVDTANVLCFQMECGLSRNDYDSIITFSITSNLRPNGYTISWPEGMFLPAYNVQIFNMNKLNFDALDNEIDRMFLHLVNCWVKAGRPRKNNGLQL